MSWLMKLFALGRRKLNSGKAAREIQIARNREVSLSERDQLELLSLFMKPSNPGNHARPGCDEIWRGKIGVSVPEAAEALCAAGLLRLANKAETLEAQLALTKLKEMARASGLKVSGRKAEIAQLLSETMVDQAIIRGIPKLYICTDGSRLLVENYKRHKKQARAEAQSETLRLLKDGRLKEACKLVSDFEAAQYFPRGINVDWKSGDGELFRAVSKVMTAIPGYLLERFKHVPDDARLLAAMSQLWGERFFPDIDDILRTNDFDRDTVALCADALCAYRPTGSSSLEEDVYGADFMWECIAKDALDTCEVCKRADGKTHRNGKEPELPHIGCRCQTGCKCGYVVATMT